MESVPRRKDAVIIAKEILIASIQGENHAYITEERAEELAKCLEIIYNKIIELIKD